MAGAGRSNALRRSARVSHLTVDTGPATVVSGLTLSGGLPLTSRRLAQTIQSLLKEDLGPPSPVPGAATLEGVQGCVPPAIPHSVGASGSDPYPSTLLA